jgi:hypothetical protein
MRRPQRLSKSECTMVRIPLAIKPDVERLTDLYIAEKLRKEAEQIEKRFPIS